MSLEAPSSGALPGALQGETEAAAGDGGMIVLEAASGGTLVVPGGSMLLIADFTRLGPDLLLTGPDGEGVLVKNFFAFEVPPTLVTEGGAQIPPDLAEALAGPLAPAQYAQAEGEAGTEPQEIGRVEEVVGEVTATRVDGTKIALAQGALVYMGDVLETGEGAAIGMVFADETTFSLGENGRMVLDELVYDPITLAGDSTFSVLQGVFVFVSGEIAANNPDQMVVRTPVVNIGIRGTHVAGYGAQEGEENLVTLLPNRDGLVGEVWVSTPEGTTYLSEAFQTTSANSVFMAPEEPYFLSHDEVRGLYGQAAALLPGGFGLGPIAAAAAEVEAAAAEAEVAALAAIEPAAGADTPVGTIIPTSFVVDVIVNPLDRLLDPLLGGTVLGTDGGGGTDDGGGTDEGGGTDDAGGGSLLPDNDSGENQAIINEATASTPSGGGTPSAPPSFAPTSSATVLTGALVANLSGLVIVGIPTLAGNGIPGEESASVFTNLDLGAIGGDSFSLSDGILLTSGDGAPNTSNTFGSSSGDASGSGDADLDDLLGNLAFTTDATILEFEFTVPAGIDAILFDFMFGTEEFPDQSIADIAAVFVDGQNFLLFPDSTIVTFQLGVNDDFFGDNSAGALAIEYDGVTAPDIFVALLDTDLNTHTIKVAVSDTSDTVFDSGLFLSAIALGSTDSLGGPGNDVLLGGAGNDVIDGLGGDDLLFGGDGNDFLRGGDGNDLVLGDDGNDILIGGPGVDNLTGGSGTDFFRYLSTADVAAASDGQTGLQTGDQITDFTSGTDMFRFDDPGFTSTTDVVDGNNFFTVPDFDGTNSAAAAGISYFVFDPNSETLYFDDDSSQDGYQVIATVQTGAAVAASDIEITD